MKQANQIIKIMGLIVALGVISSLMAQYNPHLKMVTTDPKWQWMKRLIYEQPRQHVNFAFVGGSGSWMAIDPERMKRTFKDATIWNLSSNWAGRDRDYILVKALLEKHRVDNLIIEFTTLEHLDSHFYTRFLMDPSDILYELKYLVTQEKMALFDYFSYSKVLKKNINRVILYTNDMLVRLPMVGFRLLLNLRPKVDAVNEYNETSGRHSNAFDLTWNQDKDFYTTHYATEVLRLKHDIRIYNRIPQLYQADSKAYNYLKRIKDLCDKYNTRLFFNFMPIYQGNLPSQSHYNAYVKLGPVLIPDLDELYHLKYWHDVAHLYRDGVNLYTDFLIGSLLSGGKNSPHLDLFEKDRMRYREDYSRLQTIIKKLNPNLSFSANS